MNLRKKKNLVARTLKVGKERIMFVNERLSEIKEMITKEDVKGLKEDGAIVVKEINGRKKNQKRKNRRGTGKIKMKVKTRKRDYVIMTRKLRKHVKNLHERGELAKEDKKDIRKKIRNKAFRSKAHLNEYIRGLEK